MKIVMPRAVATVVASVKPAMRCPACRRNATFDILADPRDHEIQLEAPLGSVICGVRQCPNTACRAIVFVVLNKQTHKVERSYPPETIDFDSSDIAENVASCLEEAILCHANECYRAAAIMVRKTMEELCHDQNAAGDDLKQRIIALGSTIIIPQALLNGIDNLRLLGNDAAHISANTFNDVGKEEVEVALDFAKEVLKAVYQHGALVNRINALKKP